jgi:hypothetical protein
VLLRKTRYLKKQKHFLLGVEVLKMGEDKKILEEIDMLRAEHRTIDLMILELAGADMIRIQKLKKRKLALRDQIAILEAMLYPDIIA